MSKVAELFESLDYGPAPESPTPVLEWLDRHTRAFDLFIGGRWVKATSGASFETVNPATGQPIARVAQAGPKDVDAAVRAARKAFGSWSRLSGHARALHLYAIARWLCRCGPSTLLPDIERHLEFHLTGRYAPTYRQPLA